MDSDSESLLVIDEGQQPETENFAANEMNTRDETVAATKTTKNFNENQENDETKNVSSTSSTPIPSTSKEKAKDQSRSKGDTPKSSKPHGEKKAEKKREDNFENSSEKKKFAFRLSHLKNNFQAKMLNITSLPHQFYNMRLYMAKEDYLVAELPSTSVIPPFPDVSFTELLNWPDVSIKITLDHIQFVHSLKANYERDVVFGSQIGINIDKRENVLALQQIKGLPSSKLKPTIAKELFETYVQGMSVAAPRFGVSASRKNEIDVSFKKAIAEVSSVPSPLIETRTKYARFLNKHKYMRIFDNDKKFHKENPNGYLKVILREVMNPQVVFQIEKCSIQSEKPEIWLKALDEYFRDIFGGGCKTSASQRDRYKKCISMRCSECDEKYDGPLCVVSMKEHIKDKHFVDKPWQCIKCRKRWTQSDLAQMEWHHECSEKK